MKSYDIAIVGAGPAGLMAAVTAAKSGKEVILFEKNDCIGRKLLATGNGRCNLTNKNIAVDRYHGAEQSFIRGTLEKFDEDKTIEFFESQGVALKEEEHGRIFPRSNQASTIVEALKNILEDYEVTIQTNLLVMSVEKDEDFVIKTENMGYKAKKLILTTGGKAAFQFGSSGDGMFWARKFGHNIVPIFAALVPLEVKEAWVKEVQGVKVEAKVTTKVDKEVIKESAGDILFTHFGLSGPAVMAQTGAISPLVEQNQVKIILDLFPELKEIDLNLKVEDIFKHNSKKNISNSLLGLFPAKLVPIILRIARVKGDTNTSEISKSDRLKIVKCIKSLELTVKKVRPLKEAQVSRGGIDTKEIDQNTLESKIVKGLYFAGEIMDIDGDTGGFNLQWAWSSGFVAGQTK